MIDKIENGRNELSEGRNKEKYEAGIEIKITYKGNKPKRILCEVKNYYVG